MKRPCRLWLYLRACASPLYILRKGSVLVKKEGLLRDSLLVVCKAEGSNGLTCIKEIKQGTGLCSFFVLFYSNLNTVLTFTEIVMFLASISVGTLLSGVAILFSMGLAALRST